MPWYEWLLSTLLFVVSLGVLITIHEAGHLSMAKVFKVYCHEFSIGFGPKILKKKKEGHETYFTLRAIPLGGFVSMYGEEGSEPEEGLNIPHERSLEGIKKWKKAIILSAGVILNALLALILIFVSNAAFPLIRVTTQTSVAENSIAATAGIVSDDRIAFIYPESCITEEGGIAPISYEYTDDDNVIHAGNFFIVDTTIEMFPESDPENLHHYVLAFRFTGNKGNPVFTDGISLYKGVSKTELSNYKHLNKVFADWANQEGSPEYYPNFEDASYRPSESTKFTAKLSFISKDTEETYAKTVQIETEKSANGYMWKDIGLSFNTKNEWLPFGERIKNTFVDFGDASLAVFRGIGVLFTGGIRNMSGIVGIFETSASILSNYTFATYLYFWGMISVNLAIFNLLPFPGLDGWQLLVTAIEGATRKKIPNKAKAIMSMIGLGLLFVLMIAVVVMDVIKIIGV